jgi:hypothetical protein
MISVSFLSKPGRLLVALFALVTLVVSTGAQSALPGLPTAELRSAVGAALPAEALVIFVQGDEVYLDATRARGAAIGQSWTIERPGSEIRHPVTNEVMGRARRRTGEVKLTWFQDDFSKARIAAQVEEEGGIRVKDLARPAAAPVVVLFQLRHENGTLSRLTRLIDAEVAAALAGLESAEVRAGPAIGSTAASAASVTALATEAAVAVTGRVLAESVELHIVRGSNGELVRSFTVPIPASLLPLGEEKITSVPGGAGSGALERIGYREGGEISSQLKFVPIDMTVGDLDGDGVDEIIFAEEKHLRICRLKLDGSLEEIARQSLGFTAQILKVHAADIDNDGKAEIFVTENPGNSIRSSGWRWKNNRLERFHREADMFLRTMRVGDEVHLLGQRHGSSRPFERGVVRFRSAGGGRLTSSSAGYPGTVSLYDFTPLGATGYLATIDYENRLKLLDHSGANLWTGAERYGGSDLKIQSRDKRNEMEERTGIAAVDLDGDGVPEVLVVQNLLEGGLSGGSIRVGTLQQYKSGRLVALALEKNELVERWKTKTFSGIIKGYSIGRPLARGPEALFFTVEKISLFERRAILRSVPLN